MRTHFGAHEITIHKPTSTWMERFLWKSDVAAAAAAVYTQAKLTEVRKRNSTDAACFRVLWLRRLRWRWFCFHMYVSIHCYVACAIKVAHIFRQLMCQKSHSIWTYLNHHYLEALVAMRSQTNKNFGVFIQQNDNRCDTAHILYTFWFFPEKNESTV